MSEALLSKVKVAPFCPLVAVEAQKAHGGSFTIGVLRALIRARGRHERPRPSQRSRVQRVLEAAILDDDQPIVDTPAPASPISDVSKIAI